MVVEYNFISDKSNEEILYDLTTELSYLEELYKMESEKDEPDADRLSSIEEIITSKKTEYVNLGGTYE